MKVLIINVSSHTGSTGKIAYGLYKYLKSRGDNVQLCCRGAMEPVLNEENIIGLNSKFQSYMYAIISYVTGYEGALCLRSTNKLLQIIKKFGPDLIHIFNLTGHYINYIKVLEYLKANKIKTIYSMMDDFVFTGRCSFVAECTKYQTGCEKCPHLDTYPPSLFFDFSKNIFQKKENIYRGFDSLIITGVEWSCNVAKKAKLTKGHRIISIDHPVNLTDVFYPRDSRRLRRELGIPEINKIVLTATSAKIERKGGVFFLELAKKMKCREDITFVFIGYDRSDWEIPENMITIDYVTSQDQLAEYYSLADLYVCTSLADTFPTTCINSLGCGVPLLGFATGGVPYLAPKEFGTFVPTGDIDSLMFECEKVCKKTDKTIAAIRDYAVKRYSEEVIYTKFYELYKEIVVNE